MWLLDLFGDSNPIWPKTASYHGHPFVFCTLLNFGGQQGITGDTPRVAAGFEAARARARPPAPRGAPLRRARAALTMATPRRHDGTLVGVPGVSARFSPGTAAADFVGCA